jgi:hypothetical protein
MAEVGEPVVFSTSVETGEFCLILFVLECLELCCYWQNDMDYD